MMAEELAVTVETTVISDSLTGMKQTNLTTYRENSTTMTETFNMGYPSLSRIEDHLPSITLQVNRRTTTR